MSWFGDIARFARLAATLRRTGALDFILENIGVGAARRRIVGALLWPATPLGLRGAPDLPPVARALAALGPSYVKLGQVLSTRPDLVGDAMTTDLRHLQDSLPPFAQDVARRTVEEELGAPVDALFTRFDPPIAAASIAQVHQAVTTDGRRVAVKILRPGVERAFARDISGFYFVAGLLERFRIARRLRPTDVVRHFEGVVNREMDLRLEAAAGSEYRDIVADQTGFRVPEMVWPLTSKRVLTSSWVDGDRLSDVDALRARGLDLDAMALRLVRLFLRTALRDGYFHADMHQGNLKVAPDGAIVAFDFGIMGRIDVRTRRTYAEILFSYLTRDYRRGARAHFDAGYVSREQDLERFAEALRSIGEPIVGLRASDISMGRVVQQLFDVTERFGMETRPELLLLQRTMVVVEGVARSLDPKFNMWEAARPEVESFMAENLGPRAVLRDLQETAVTLARLGPRLPEFADQLTAMADAWRDDGPGSGRRPPQRGAERPGLFWRGVLAGLLGAALTLGAVAAFSTESPPDAPAASEPETRATN